MPLTASVRIKITRPGSDLPGAFGLGCVLLLEGVAEEKSLNRAAKRIGMSYSKAWRIVREAEAHLGYELMTRDGARGSVLTDRGVKALAAFRQIQSEAEQLVTARLSELLP